MPFVSSDVTHTEVAGSAQSVCPKGGRSRQADLTFGNGVITYTIAAGVPLDKAKLGCPTVLLRLDVLGRTETAAGTNYVWEWNKSQTAPALTGFEVRTGQAGPEGLTEIADTTAIVAQNIRVVVEGY